MSSRLPPRNAANRVVNNTTKSSSMPSINQQQRKELTRRQKTLIRVSVNSNNSSRNSTAAETAKENNNQEKFFTQTPGQKPILSFTGENKYASTNPLHAQSQVIVGKDSMESFNETLNTLQSESITTDERLWSNNLVNQYVVNHARAMTSPTPSGNFYQGNIVNANAPWNPQPTFQDEVAAINYQADLEAMNFLNNINYHFGSNSKMFAMNNKTYPVRNQKNGALFNHPPSGGSQQMNSSPHQFNGGPHQPRAVTKTMPMVSHRSNGSAKLHRYDRNNTTHLLNPLVHNATSKHDVLQGKSYLNPQTGVVPMEQTDGGDNKLTHMNNITYPLTVLQKPITPLPHSSPKNWTNGKTDRGRIPSLVNGRPGTKPMSGKIKRGKNGGIERSSSSNFIRSGNGKYNKIKRGKKLRSPENYHNTAIAGAAIKLSPRNIQVTTHDPGIITHLNGGISHIDNVPSSLSFQLSTSDLLQ